MPVTAKLSRRFYEQLGDELANERVDWFNTVDATYRSDLDRLNELNFARFDAKLEQRLAQLEMKLNTDWERRFTRFEVRFARQLGALRTELLRWMFTFWTGTTAAHSARIATTGVVIAARRAGIQHAPTATTKIASAATAKLVTSAADTP